MPDPEYFTLAEFRLEQDMGDTSRFPNELVLRVAASVVTTIERVVGTSFVGRTVTETVTGNRDGLALSHAYVLSPLTSITEGGVAVTDELRTVGGVVQRYSAGTNVTGWWSPDGTVVTYLAGYSAVPPADIKEAAIQATRARLLSAHGNSGAPDRATSLSNGDGTYTLTYAGKDHPFGYPEVDEVIVGWRDKLAGFGFA